MGLIKFDSMDEVKRFYSSLGANNTIGAGAEGTCFLANDNYVYKVFDGLDDRELNPYDIKTASDIESDYIIFPEDIYVVDDKLVGYKTRYVPNDVFLDPRILYELEGNEHLVIRAFYKMVEEIKRLANKKMFMYELGGNLLFDGRNFYAIDTCEYQYLPNASEEEIVAMNVEMLIYALEMQFMLEENELMSAFLEKMKKQYVKNNTMNL